MVRCWLNSGVFGSFPSLVGLIWNLARKHHIADFGLDNPGLMTAITTLLTTHSVQLTPAQADRLEPIIRDGTFELREVPYARCSGVRKDFNVTLYQSGKVVVQGKGTRDFVEFVLEPQVLQEARLGYEEILAPELLEPRLGVDEAGKGDFFGPLAIAGVYVNANIVRGWKDKGIQDSKTVGNDKRIAELAKLIRETPGCVVSTVSIGPEAYNRMYTKFKSLNRLLAWGHARVIENLMEQGPRMSPPPIRAISDQFARDESTVAKALLPLGRTLKLEQRHRAEADAAVAAASILARDEFVARIDQLGREFGMTLPKGAAPQVETAGKQFVKRHGAEALPKVAKMHFRTSYRVLGIPEPPKLDPSLFRRPKAS